MNTRVQWIDIVKGIGIVLVTVGHTNARHLFGDYVGWWINAFHMPLFFVMAGLCFDFERYPNFWMYLLRKIKALGWPYFALAAFMALLSVVFYLGSNPRWSFCEQVRPFLTCDTKVNTFWFIKTLFEVEVVFWLIVKLTSKRCLILGVSFLLGGIGVFVVPEGEQVLKYNTMLLSLFYYGVGYCAKDVAKLLSAKSDFFLWGAGGVMMTLYSVLVATVFHYTVGYWGCLLGNKYLFFPLSLLAIVGVTAASMALSRIQYVRDVFVWLGVNSIVLMAIHGHCGIFRASWVENGLAYVSSIVAEYALFAVLAWTLAGPMNFLVKFPWPNKKS